MWLMLIGLLASPSWADEDDDDGDGYGEGAGDCDDRDPTVYPGAPESCDGQDNDCDGTIDEGTPCYDDDNDGFTEEEGDCSDADPTVNPNATERLNQRDDDCDGIIDEGTENYDDDQDGYTELDGDCDDDNDQRSPALPDYCRDGIDNDCSGAADDECIEDPSDGCDPNLTVILASSRFSAPPATEVFLEALPIFNDTRLSPNFSWQVEDGTLDAAELDTGSAFSEEDARLETSQTDVSWFLPDEPGLYLASVTISDRCGFTSLDQLEIEVRDNTPPERFGSYQGGCGTGRLSAVLLPGILLPGILLPGILAKRRKRRD